MRIFQLFLLFLFLTTTHFRAQAQATQRLPFFQPADSLHKTRFWTLSELGAGTYSGIIIGLNSLWYSDYPRSSFHFFNDTGEWEYMDKTGHINSTYNASRIVFQSGLWAGLSRKQAMWTGVGLSWAFMFTVEMLDGFSKQWGFSLPDLGFNTGGVVLFGAQEMLWKEQRIYIKVSSNPTPYPNDQVTLVVGSDPPHPPTLKERARDIYGNSIAQVFLKDYNALNAWVSVNPYSFMPKTSKFPKWLNVAVGYGAANLYAGYDNTWEQDGNTYQVDKVKYPVYNQYYLSLDIDFTRIPTKSHFLKGVFTMLNIFKFPAPALEYNSLGKWKFHPIYF